MPKTRQLFRYDHLPPHLAVISAPFANLALWMDEILPPGDEKNASLRELVKAKDFALRAGIDAGAKSIEQAVSSAGRVENG